MIAYKLTGHRAPNEGKLTMTTTPLVTGPQSVDRALAQIAIEASRTTDPDQSRYASTVYALHWLTGYLADDTMTGRDLQRLLGSATAFHRARALELADQYEMLSIASRAA